eukprot:508170-Ditylum_brightwellii.AAC.1
MEHIAYVNSAMNLVPLSSITSVGQGYWLNHVCSMTFAMMSAHLVFILTISNHPVAGSIMVTDHK